MADNIDFSLAVPTAKAGFRIIDRPFTMVALQLEDFEINSTNISEVLNINGQAGGNADIGFLAYNQDAFNINSPVVSDFPVSRNICRLPSEIDVSFTVSASLNEPAAPGNEDESEIRFQWSKFNDEYGASPAPADISITNGENTTTITVSNVDFSNLGTYNLRVFNDFGAVVVPVEILEGGVPAFWNGSSFELPAALSSLDVPDQDRSLRFSSTDYNGSGNIEGCDCIVSPGRTVTIDGKLTLYNELIIEPPSPVFDDEGNQKGSTPSGTVTFLNNSSLVQTIDILNSENNNQGNIIYKRTADNLQSSDYVYWSSPVDNFEIGNISGNNTFRWDTQESNVNGTHGNWVTVANNQEMEAGIGYIKRVPAGTPEIYTDFVGRPRNGRIEVGLMQTPTGATPGASKHWNLVGNPYPSAISATKFILENASDIEDSPAIEGAVHLWTHGNQISSALANDDPFYQNFGLNYDSNDYVSYNATGNSFGPETFDGNIATGQGFFVKAKGNITNPKVVFTNLMRFNPPANEGDPADSFDNNQFFRGSGLENDKPRENNQKIWLSLINGSNLSSNILIGYVDGATLEKDNLYDARTNGGEFSIYSLIEKEKMVIQGRPVPFDETDTVPIGVILNENGMYTIAIHGVEGNLFEEDKQPFFLEDVYLNRIHDLSNAPYIFSAKAGELSDRFLLRYTNETLSSNTVDVSKTFVFINESKLHIKADKPITAVEVYDLNGKRLMRNYATGQTEIETDFNHPNGIYLASILFNDGSLMNKKIVN